MAVRPTAVLLGVLATGVVAVCDPAGWSPFGPAKWLVVSAVGTALAAAVVLGGRSWAARRRDLGLVVAFGLAVGAASANALDPHYAWIGTPERRFGALTWLFVGAAFVAGRSLRGVDDRRIVARGAVGGALVTALWCAAEAMGIEPIGLAAETDRLTGPFGSAAYLGAAAVLLGAGAVGVAADRDESRGWRGAAAAGAAGCLLAVIGSGARAAWVGVFVVGAVVVVRGVHSGRRTGPRTWGLLAVGIGLPLVLLAPRLADVLDRPHGATSRLDEWAVAVRVVGHHPWLGVGPEGYRIGFADGVDDDYERRYGRDVLPDRAHSGPLDVAVTLGVPAATLWAAAVVAVLRAAWRARTAGDPVLVGLAAGVAAYLVQQLFLFPLAELDVLVAGFAGCVVAAAGPVGGSVRTGRMRPWVRGVGEVVAIGLVAAAFVSGVRDVVADRFARRAADGLAQVAPTPAELTAARDAATASVGWRGDVLRTRLLLARLEEATGTRAGVDRAIVEVDRALEVSPGDPIVRTEAARLASVAAEITGDPAALDDALAGWLELVADDPHRAAWQLGAGRAAAAAGEVDVAIAAVGRAAFLAPGDPTAAALLAALQRVGDG